MPFAVRQWPVSPDPRGSFYSFEGWDWGQVVSWQWVVSTTGATGAWAFLNDGFVITSIADNGIDTEWFGVVPDTANTTVRLRKFAHVPPVGIPPFSIELLLQVDVPSTGEQGEAINEFLFPHAIQVFGPWEMLDFGIVIPDLPNHIKITPAIWNL